MMQYSLKFKKQANKIKFKKIKGTFLDIIPWLKSYRPPLRQLCVCEKQCDSNSFAIAGTWTVTYTPSRNNFKIKYCYVFIVLLKLYV